MVPNSCMKQTDPQFKLRIPAELKARIDEAAKLSRRSATAEITARLEETFELDLAMDKLRFGDHTATKEILNRLLAENEQLGTAAAISKADLRHELSKIIDERIDLLESRLLSLPDSSFGKSLTKKT